MEDIIKDIKDDLKDLETSIQKLVTTKVGFIKDIVNYIIRSGGKRIRPLLVILCAKLSGYNNNRHISYAAIIEFIHTATLLHDDVVDNAKMRRGASSVNVLWGNEPSVLVGDFLYSKSFELMAEDGHHEIIKTISKATTALSEGEILELLQTSDIDTTEEQYFDIVKNKTATLFSAACEVGGMLGNISEEERLALRNFGYKLGMAFQLVDDILDYTSYDNVLGKHVGTDLKEGKVTLPLIHAITSAKPRERLTIKKIMNKTNVTPGDFERVRKLIVKYQGIEYTSRIAREYIDDAKQALTIFPFSAFTDALMKIADYIVRREM
jgi:octaprenyl-diphosphate synthase